MSYLANSEVNSPRPCVIWRSVSAKSPSSASGGLREELGHAAADGVHAENGAAAL